MPGTQQSAGRDAQTAARPTARRYTLGEISMTKSNSEHALAIIKAGISAVPIVGGSISSLIGDYIPTATQKSIDFAIHDLRTKLESIVDRIDAETINKDHFAEIFKSSYLIIVRTHQEKKIKAATALIANIFLKEGDPEKLNFTELDHFTRCLDSLSIGAIEVIANVSNYIAKKHYKGDLSQAYGGDYNEGRTFDFGALQNRLPDTHPSLLMGLVSELNSLNLLHMSGAPVIRTENYGNYPIELSILGVRFVLTVLKDVIE